MKKVLLSIALAAMTCAGTALHAQTYIDCIDQSSAAYPCMNLLDTIANIRIATEMRNGAVKLYSYAATGSLRSPVDYQFRRSGSNIIESCDDSGNALCFSVTYPVNYHYNTCPALPCMVIFHPGGYKESNGAGTQFNSYINAIAKRGYVVFNVQYRTGWNIFTQPPTQNYNPPAQIVAAYRAAQDIRGALKSIKKMKSDGIFPDSLYKFDINKLYIGGASAGAFQCISAAYIDQTEPRYAAPGLKDVLGTLDKPLSGYYYYGTNAVSMPVIRGVWDMWGAGSAQSTANPNFAVFIDTPAGDPDLSLVPPLIAFHGELDSVAPASSRQEYFTDTAVHQCSGAQRLDYEVPAASLSTGFRSYGSIPIYRQLNKLGIPAELYLDSDMEHGLGSNSDFGLANPTEEDVIAYMAGRAATFFQAVISNRIAGLSVKVFRDTRNCRYGNQDDASNPCNNSVPNICNTAFSKGTAGMTEAIQELSIMPNPAAGAFRISLKGDNIIDEVTIYNQIGQLVFHKPVNETMTIISPAEAGYLAPGIYFINVISGRRCFHKKLEIQ